MTGGRTDRTGSNRTAAAPRHHDSRQSTMGKPSGRDGNHNRAFSNGPVPNNNKRGQGEGRERAYAEAVAIARVTRHRVPIDGWGIPEVPIPHWNCARLARLAEAPPNHYLLLVKQKSIPVFDLQIPIDAVPYHWRPWCNMFHHNWRL